MEEGQDAFLKEAEALEALPASSTAVTARIFQGDVCRHGRVRAFVVSTGQDGWLDAVRLDAVSRRVLCLRQIVLMRGGRSTA